MSSGVKQIRTVYRVLTGTTAAYVLIIVVSIPLIYLFAFRDMRFFLVPSGSMEPTLYRRDCLITLSEKDYERGDVIVLHDPLDPQGYLVKRIIGIGGDTVAVSKGRLYVNQAQISEPYIAAAPEYEMQPVEVPEGRIFVLGDNRNNSDDSHAWTVKTVPAGEIVGRVKLIYYPYQRAGAVKNYFVAMAQQSNAKEMTSR